MSDPQPILTQNGSNDVDSDNNVPFAVKIATFHTPDLQGPQKVTFSQILDLENFSLDLAFNIRGPQRENTPYSSPELNEIDIVNRQSGGEKLIYT